MEGRDEGGKLPFPDACTPDASKRNVANWGVATALSLKHLDLVPEFSNCVCVCVCEYVRVCVCARARECVCVCV